MATFVARLTSLPRAVLYTGFQTAGGALGGLFLRAGIGNRNFKVGGCWLFLDVVPVREAFAIEFVAGTALLFFAIGVGLHPRQRKIIPPALAPFLVGLSLGTISWMTGGENPLPCLRRLLTGLSRLYSIRLWRRFNESCKVLRYVGWQWVFIMALDTLVSSCYPKIYEESHMLVVHCLAYWLVDTKFMG